MGQNLRDRGQPERKAVVSHLSASDAKPKAMRRMYCDVCESMDHVRLRCPKVREVKGVVVPCGFAVEGLGFFHIPHESSAKQRTEARLAMIRVSDGELSVQNVIAELQRLILGG
jgi:hypothetical protein